ncbi:uncharacterized protein LOC114521673 isoform X2 [Dendronephthya gigantea]|uniref:uncharacterized protein LOC114521673 isoform X2 n=1 Tax=Dendronephthya gigantea TaxID=151771 RepID=UPI001068FB59|nr:uncharacterized protein LOC114521673 isoform X2 [Dendronephthya gigantea]
MDGLAFLNITQENLNKAKMVVEKSPFVLRTPILKNAEELFGLDKRCNLHIKLETLQKTGSFKTRGLVNQLAHLPPSVLEDKKSLVAMSAGNYGKAFAFAAQQLGLPATVVMPDVAPISRVKIIEGYGAHVERVPVQELKQTVDRHVIQDGMHFLHSFDDTNLICGCASAGFEMLDDIPNPDIVVVCCGGGGLLSGVAAAMKHSGKTTKVYGAEPEGAPKMFQSLQEGKAVTLKSIDTIASGLAPPMAGKNNFEVIKNCIEGIILVSDEEIGRAMRVLYDGGLVVEPSGAAAFAALLANKVPGVKDNAQHPF